MTESRLRWYPLDEGDHLSQGNLTLTTTLECAACRCEISHDVHYVAGLLHWVKCHGCGWRWEISHQELEEFYLRQLPLRIASKPLRLGLEARRHPVRFARSFPIRMMTKPIRVAREMAEVVGLREA